LITGLSKALRIEEAKKLLTIMWERGCSHSVKSFTSYIGALCTSGKVVEAFQTLDLMVTRHCVPDDVTYLVISQSLTKANLQHAAFKILAEKASQPTGMMVEVYEKLLEALKASDAKERAETERTEKPED
jgi:pentatricopeptide repeat protein